MPEQAGAEHTFVFYCSTTGLTNTSFTKYLYKNGARNTTQSVQVNNATGDANVYMASFTDDGTDRASWDLVVKYSPDYWTAHFYCETDVVRKTLAYLRSQADSILNYLTRLAKP